MNKPTRKEIKYLEKLKKLNVSSKWIGPIRGTNILTYKESNWR